MVLTRCCHSLKTVSWHRRPKSVQARRFAIPPVCGAARPCSGGVPVTAHNECCSSTFRVDLVTQYTKSTRHVEHKRSQAIPSARARTSQYTGCIIVKFDHAQLWHPATACKSCNDPGSLDIPCSVTVELCLTVMEVNDLAGVLRDVGAAFPDLAGDLPRRSYPLFRARHMLQECCFLVADRVICFQVPQGQGARGDGISAGAGAPVQSAADLLDKSMAVQLRVSCHRRVGPLDGGMIESVQDAWHG